MAAAENSNEYRELKILWQHCENKDVVCELAAITELSQILSIFNQLNIHLIEFNYKPRTNADEDGYPLSIILHEKDNCQTKIEEVIEESPAKPSWFPRTVYQLTKNCNELKQKTLSDSRIYQGYSDPVYLERLTYFKGLTTTNEESLLRHKRPDYNRKEIETWKMVFRRLTLLHDSYASSWYIQNFKTFVNECHISEHEIPSVRKIASYIHTKAGFRLRTIPSTLSSRHFFAHLAFRYLPIPAHIRHFLSPFHSPDVDIVHVILGHIPQLLDTRMAHFLQQLGTLTLGADEQTLTKVEHVYFQLIEYGLIKENNELKAIGAALLSSYGELCHSLSDKAVHYPFSILKCWSQQCNDNTFQESYTFIETGIHEALESVISYFENNDKRLFNLSYCSIRESFDLQKKVVIEVNF
ncbi:hypothetical protein ACOME3_005903 [Neoechinorhynchus agilis]